MAYLALNNLVDAVLTEDSDLLCYGCPTVGQSCIRNRLAAPRVAAGTRAFAAVHGHHPPRVQVFFKMDKGGEGEEVRLTDLPAAKELAFQGFGQELFQEVRRALLGCACQLLWVFGPQTADFSAQRGYVSLWVAPGVLCRSAAALLQMCVLAGCDFVASLPGIGIKKAHQHLRRTRCFLKARLHALRCF